MIVKVVLISAALLPAILLMRYIYRMDKVEKEPVGMLLKLVVYGAVAGLLAGTLNQIGVGILSSFFETDSVAFYVCLAFLVVGVVEEGLKFTFLRLGTWRNPNFNFRFDGIVYAAFVSLGFAALENITYIFNYGLSIVIQRALLSVPAHMGFAVFMGTFYGRARVCYVYNDRAGMKKNLWLAYIVAIFLHGFYDACAMTKTTLSAILFWAFVVVMYIVVIRRIKLESAADRAIGDQFYHV